MANRHLARSIVLQTLFEWDFNGRDNSKLRNILHENIGEFGPGLTDFSFLESLLESVINKLDVIDPIISKAAPEWPLDRISVVDRNVLRIGIYELLFMEKTEVPAKVAINEAIELAKTFGGENSGKFINGVMGTIYKEMGEPGKDEVTKIKKTQEPIDPKDLPVEKLGGMVVYHKNENGDIHFAMVHDIFGYWTLSKGRIEDGEREAEAASREVMEEIGILAEPIKKLGTNEYIASDPKKGKILKKVSYFLGKTEDILELKLKDTGGLDDARWFEISEILHLRMYDDIVPLITEAIKTISQ